MSIENKVELTHKAEWVWETVYSESSSQKENENYLLEPLGISTTKEDHERI